MIDQVVMVEERRFPAPWVVIDVHRGGGRGQRITENHFAAALTLGGRGDPRGVGLDAGAGVGLALHVGGGGGGLGVGRREGQRIGGG